MKNQQKIPKQRLNLSKETIRELQRSEVVQVAGGSVVAGSARCTPPTQHPCLF